MPSQGTRSATEFLKTKPTATEFLSTTKTNPIHNEFSILPKSEQHDSFFFRRKRRWQEADWTSWIERLHAYPPQEEDDDHDEEEDQEGCIRPSIVIVGTHLDTHLARRRLSAWKIERFHPPPPCVDDEPGSQPNVQKDKAETTKTQSKTPSKTPSDRKGKEETKIQSSKEETTTQSTEQTVIKDGDNGRESEKPWTLEQELAQPKVALERKRRGICVLWEMISKGSGERLKDPLILECILRYHLDITDEDIGVQLFGFQINEKLHLAMQLIRHTMSGIALLGFGGAGKSTIIKYLVREMRATGVPGSKDGKRTIEVGVCAYTGLAACTLGLGGTTVHSYFGFSKDAKESADDMVQKWVDGKKREGSAGHRLASVAKIVIDEFTMVTFRMLCILDMALRVYRGNRSLPFGGIQFILIGDFAQLRPITKKPQDPVIMTEEDRTEDKSQTKLPFSGMAGDEEDEQLPLYKTRLWTRCFRYVILLDYVYRQRDPTMIDLMSRCRRGHTFMTHEDHRLLHGRVISRPQFEAKMDREERAADAKKEFYIPPLYIHPWNKCVEPWNLDRMNRLRTPEERFDGKIDFLERGKADRPEGQEFKSRVIYSRNTWNLRGFQAEKARELQVLGSSFIKDVPVQMSLKLKVGAQVMLVKNLNVRQGLANGTRGRIVHIGPTLPEQYASTNIGEPSDHSRLEGESELDAKADGHAILVWVKFNGVDNIYPISPASWEIPALAADINKDQQQWREVISLKQVPLILLWASTVHRVQGQSLDREYANLGWPCSLNFGQAYVALSRVRKLENCWLEEYNNRVFNADLEYIAYEDYLLSDAYCRYLLELPFRDTLRGPAMTRR